MDLTRVGIFGGSAGGQSSTRALLAHGDFYQVGVSDCGCHDNRMDKIWWNELWMGWPLGDHYAEQSNVTNAHRLTGKLLLIVGELDRNVDPASTMQVVNALIKSDRDFEMLVVPGGRHGIAESKYGTRRRRDFFVRNLLGVEPRRTSNVQRGTWNDGGSSKLEVQAGPLGSGPVAGVGACGRAGVAGGWGRGWRVAGVERSEPPENVASNETAGTATRAAINFERPTPYDVGSSMLEVRSWTFEVGRSKLDVRSSSVRRGGWLGSSGASPQKTWRPTKLQGRRPEPR